MNRLAIRFVVLTAVIWMMAPGTTSLASADAAKIRVILDTDANNELDDQHAIAYLLFNGDVHQHYAEAERIVKLCGLE